MKYAKFRKKFSLVLIGILIAFTTLIFMLIENNSKQHDHEKEALPSQSGVKVIGDGDIDTIEVKKAPDNHEDIQSIQHQEGASPLQNSDSEAPREIDREKIQNTSEEFDRILQN